MLSLLQQSEPVFRPTGPKPLQGSPNSVSLGSQEQHCCAAQRVRQGQIMSEVLGDQLLRPGQSMQRLAKLLMATGELCFVASLRHLHSALVVLGRHGTSSTSVSTAWRLQGRLHDAQFPVELRSPTVVWAVPGGVHLAVVGAETGAREILAPRQVAFCRIGPFKQPKRTAGMYENPRKFRAGLLWLWHYWGTSIYGLEFGLGQVRA